MKSKIIVSFIGFCLITASYAQNIYNLNGSQYEAIQWPDTSGFFFAFNGASLQGTWSGGSVSFGGGTHLQRIADDNFSFTGDPYMSGGYEISGVDEFRVNGGEINDGSADNATGGGNLVQDMVFANAVNPTRLLYYIGINDPGNTVNGLKYASWDFSSSDTGTTFQVLGNTAAFTIAGNGTSSLGWTTTGVDNNASSVLVEITNPNGIGNIHIETNRLDINGNNIKYTSPNQSADFQPVALLVQVPEPSSIALLGFGGIAFLIRRKRA